MPFAFFADILGTSCTVTRLPDDHQFSDDRYTHHWRTRTEFQSALRSLARDEDALLCAIFSDCGYLVMESPIRLLHAVRRFMSVCRSTVPVRGGIGYGNFAIDQTMHSWRGKGGALAEASFYGSALVRAHRAESCGHKGFRVLVHQSAAERLSQAHEGITVYPEDISPRDEEYIRPPPVPGTIVQIPSSPFSDVSFEVCCIGDDSIKDWNFGVEYIVKVQQPDDSALIHYSETKAALSRFEALRSSAHEASQETPLK